MEKGSNLTGAKKYASISSEITQLLERIGEFKKRKGAVAQSFRSFSDCLASYRIVNLFPKMEGEINKIIGSWDCSIPLASLKKQISVHMDKIASVDNEIEKVKALHQSLLQYPERHNRKQVTDKMHIFLRNVNGISLSQLDQVCGVVIPTIHRMAKGVLDRFDEENKKVAQNKRNAKKLKTRISGYDLYVDKFNLRKICVDGNVIANEILQSPNVSRPEEDASRLHSVSKSLDQCIGRFRKEDKLFDEIKTALCNNRNSYWKEDYDSLMSILMKGACYVQTTASQLQAQYNKIVGVKNREITQAVSVFRNKIQDYFSDEIRSLRDGVHTRQDLSDLVKLINQKVAEDKRRLIILALKCIGLIAAVGAFVWVIIEYVVPWVISNYIWVIIGAIVIGLIVFIIAKHS